MRRIHGMTSKSFLQHCVMRVSRAHPRPARPSLSMARSRRSLHAQSLFLQQEIFNSIHSETEMMRYLRTLQGKDLALDTSMISLGSCTMKLNSVSSLAPCSWPEVANMHPFAPASQTAGYQEMLDSLEQYLISCTSTQS